MENKILEKNGLKWSNKYYEYDNYILLNVSKEETNESYDVLIDKDDFDLIKQGQWFVLIQQEKEHHKPVYNVLWSKSINGKQHNFHIYQWILKTKGKENLVVDHINMNRLDNRRSNLRITTCQVNSINQEHKGYNYDLQTGKYLVRIKINKKCINIGRYDTELEAETIYLKACLLIHKEDVSYNVKERIDKLNITLTDEDYKNKYIIKIINILNGVENPKDLNGQYNMKYKENIKIIYKLFIEGYNWNDIARYLVDNNLQNKAKGETAKKYLIEYIKENIAI